MNGIIFNIPILTGNSTGQPGTGRAEFEINLLPYIWDSNFGELTKQDILTFPLLSTLIKISCNFPIRLRIYRSLIAREVDLNRPPYILPEGNGILLEAMLGGNSSDAQLELAPFILIAGVLQVPIILEKLLPDEATIDLLIESVN